MGGSRLLGAWVCAIWGTRDQGTQGWDAPDLGALGCQVFWGRGAAVAQTGGSELRTPGYWGLRPSRTQRNLHAVPGTRLAGAGCRCLSFMGAEVQRGGSWLFGVQRGLWGNGGSRLGAVGEWAVWVAENWGSMGWVQGLWIRECSTDPPFSTQGWRVLHSTGLAWAAPRLPQHELLLPGQFLAPHQCHRPCRAAPVAHGGPGRC